MLLNFVCVFFCYFLCFRVLTDVLRQLNNILKRKDELTRDSSTEGGMCLHILLISSLPYLVSHVSHCPLSLSLS